MDTSRSIESIQVIPGIIYRTGNLSAMEGGGDSRVSLYQSQLEREGTQTNIHYHVFDMIQFKNDFHLHQNHLHAQSLTGINLAETPDN